MRAPPAVAAAVGTAAPLLLVYLATLAPGVTLWDAGELIAAMHGLGIPHPPGTALFVAIGRAWALLLPGVPTALVANLLSAVATAAACGAAALLLARGLRSARAGLAAGVGAGLVATVWRGATETEVYAVALLLAALTLLAAERAGRTGDGRWLALTAYLLALAVPLHLFALVAAPAALLLAASDGAGRWRPRAGLLLGAAFVAVVGLGTVRPVLLVAAAFFAAAALAPARALPAAVRARWPAAANDVRASRRTALHAVAGALSLLLGASAALMLLARAAHDPPVNQGNPATWGAFLDVLARRQYDVAPLWPRQAPLWLQLGNVVEYADWQFALGLAPAAPPAWARTPVTLLFAVLGAYGSLRHRRRDRRGWRAWLVLLLAGSAGAVLWLNLKAGPSFGDGILPPGAPREARERDYFFTFAFWAWGAWAGLGAAALGSRLAARAPAARWAVPAALLLVPLVANWRAADRRRGPDAALARDAARALLLPAPPGAVLLSAGDNDTYPLWYLQQAEGARPDVTVIVTPLLPARWYREELARRHGLGELPAPERWDGAGPTVRRLVDAARARGRPVLAGVLLPAATRDAAGVDWRLHGPWWRLADGTDLGADSAVAVAVAARLAARQVGRGLSLPATADPAARAMRRLLSCAPLLARRDEEARALLASRCNRR